LQEKSDSEFNLRKPEKSETGKCEEFVYEIGKPNKRVIAWRLHPDEYTYSW